MEHLPRMPQDHWIEQALQRLLPYVQYLFHQWDKAVGKWPEMDQRRQHLKHLAEHVLGLFGQQYDAILKDPKQTLLSAETRQQLYSLLRAYKRYQTTLAKTPSEFDQIPEDTEILSSTGILPLILDLKADTATQQTWHQEVSHSERLFLYKSGHYTGYFIGHGEDSGTASCAQRARYWQALGARLIHAGHWEQALRWVMSAFLAERPHQQATFNWVPWLQLFGQIAEYAFATATSSPMPEAQSINLLKPDYRHYQRELYRARGQLQRNFRAIPMRVYPNPHLTQALQNWQTQLNALLTQMLQEAELLIGTPRCPYAIVYTGSLSRNAATAYSDLEIMLLVEDPRLSHALKAAVDQQPITSQPQAQQAQHILHLLRLFRFKLASLGDSAFALDESGDPLRDSHLIGTPEECLQAVQAAEHQSGDRGWAYSLVHIQANRCYANPPGHALLRRYKALLQRAFAAPDPMTHWHPIPWLLDHQADNHRSYQKSVLDSGAFDLKMQALKPLTLCIIDIAGLAGLAMHSVPAALQALQQADYLPVMVTRALQALWEGLLQWRCAQQLQHQAPIDQVLDSLTPAQQRLKDQVTQYLTAFYDLLPWLKTHLTPNTPDLRSRLHQALTIWAVTAALYYHASPVIAEAFQTAAQQGENSVLDGIEALLESRHHKHSLLEVVMDTTIHLKSTAAGLRMLYAPLYQIWIANTALDAALTQAVMAYRNPSPHITSVPMGQEQVTAARLWLREYPALETYDDATRLTVCRHLEALRVSNPYAPEWGQTVWLRQALDDGKTQTILTLITLGAAQGWEQPQDLMRLYQYLERQRQGTLQGPWADAKAQLQATHIAFDWLVCQREALSLALHPGALPLRTYDSLDDTQDIHYTLPPTWVTQLFDDAGQPQGTNRDGKRTVGEMYDDHYHLHVKFFPELPGVEAAVQALSLQFGLGGIAPSQLCRCPYQPRLQERIPDNQHHLDSDQRLGQPVLLSLHIPGINVQQGFRDNPVEMEAQLAQLHQGHFTRLLLLTLLIHPEDGQPANFILTKIEPDSQGRPYQLISVDNDHAFVVPWVQDDQGRPQMQIKTVVFCVPAMHQPLDAAVLRTFQQAGDPMALIRHWLQTLDQRYDAYFRLFTESERKALQAPHQQPYRLQNPDPISPLLQLTLYDVSGVYERLERLRTLLDTPELDEPWTGLTLLAHVSPQVAPSYAIVHQCYATVQDRFAHISDQQYKTILRRDPITQQEQLSYQTYQTSDKLLAQRGIPRKALIQGLAFRPCDILPRLDYLSTNHRDTIRRQLLSSDPSQQAQGQKAYDELLLDTQRAQVLTGVDMIPLTEEARILRYWQDLTVIDMTLCGFTQLTDPRFQALLTCKPLLQSLFLSASPNITPATLETLAQYAPRLRQLWLHDCPGIITWPNFIFPTGLWALFTSPKSLVWTHLQTLHLHQLPLQQLTLATPELVQLDISQCPQLLTISFSATPTKPLQTLTLAQLPQLNPNSFLELWASIDTQTRVNLTDIVHIPDAQHARQLLALVWQTGRPTWEATLPWLRALIDTVPPGHPSPETGTLDLRGLPLPHDSAPHLAILRGKPISHWVLPLIQARDLLPLWQRPDTRTIAGYHARDTMSSEDGPKKMRAPQEQSPSSRIPSLPTWDCHQTLTGYTSWVRALATCPDGAFLSGSLGTTIRYWRPSPDGFVLHQTLSGHTDLVTALATYPDGAFLSGSNDNTIRYWRPSHNSFVLHQILAGHISWVRALATFPDGTFLSTSNDNTICSWHPSPNGFILHQTLSGHTDAVWALATCPDGAFLSGSWDNTIRYWRPSPNGFVLHQTLTGHTSTVRALATYPDGTFLSGSRDKTIRYWRPAPNGFVLHQTLSGHTDWVTALATCPDGAFLSGSRDKTIRYWRPSPNGFVLHQTLSGHTDGIMAVATFPDGACLSGSDDKTIRYWTQPLCRFALPTVSDLTTHLAQYLPGLSLWQLTQPMPHRITVMFTATLALDTILYLKAVLDSLAFALAGTTPFTLAFHAPRWELTFNAPNPTDQQLMLALIDTLHDRCLAAITVSNIPCLPSARLASPNHSPTFFRTAPRPGVPEQSSPKTKSFSILSRYEQ